MKVVVLDGYLVNFDQIGWELDDRFEVQWHDSTPDCQVAQRIGDAQAAFTNRAPITAEIFDACPALKFVGTFGTGFNMVDLEAARRAGDMAKGVFYIAGSVPPQEPQKGTLPPRTAAM